jgi:PIN domain nuclease of toxin-antitoxin system
VILLDTHVLLWLSFDPNRLSTVAHRAIADAQNKGEALAICDISLLELAILASKQRYQVVLAFCRLRQRRAHELRRCRRITRRILQIGLSPLPRSPKESL